LHSIWDYQQFFWLIWLPLCLVPDGAENVRRGTKWQAFATCNRPSLIAFCPKAEHLHDIRSFIARSLDDFVRLSELVDMRSTFFVAQSCKATKGDAVCSEEKKMAVSVRADLIDG
jgi:hypothetical protein